MTRPRLYLHVGLQKTGTSYLQSVLRRSTAQLRDQGLELVPPTGRGAFWLMLDVRGRFDPAADPPEAGHAVERLPGELAASATPRALITEESLAPASEEQIRRLLDACTSHEVHLVLTVRDLGRQIPSSWQQRLRTGSPEPFTDYLDRLRRTEGSTTSGVWRQKDVTQVLGRWGTFVPPERTHVVLVPPAGGPPDLLLRRFCEVLELDAGSLRADAPRANEALGHVGVELLRRVNERLAATLDDDLRHRQVFGAVGKRYFALRVLGPDSGHRVRMPAELEDWCRSVSEKYAAFLRDGGYHVVGDLDDLIPDPSSFSAEGHLPTDAELVETGVDALATVLTDRLVEKRDERRRGGRQAKKATAGGGPGTGRRRPRWRRWLA